MWSSDRRLWGCFLGEKPTTRPGQSFTSINLWILFSFKEGHRGVPNFKEKLHLNCLAQISVLAIRYFTKEGEFTKSQLYIDDSSEERRTVPRVLQSYFHKSSTSGTAFHLMHLPYLNKNGRPQRKVPQVQANKISKYLPQPDLTILTACVLTEFTTVTLNNLFFFKGK